MAILRQGALLGDSLQYEVIAKLGQGEFAEVWEVKDLSITNTNQHVSTRNTA